MKFKVQVATISEDGEESIRELACVEREDLTAESLGLSVSDSKALLQSLQEVVVEWQRNTYLESQRHCPDCGKLRHSKSLILPHVPAIGEVRHTLDICRHLM